MLSVALRLSFFFFFTPQPYNNFLNIKHFHEMRQFLNYRL